MGTPVCQLAGGEARRFLRPVVGGNAGATRLPATVGRIDAVLSALKPCTRRVFLLNQLDELSYDAIARQLDISRITVRRDMALAIRAICVATE